MFWDVDKGFFFSFQIKKARKQFLQFKQTKKINGNCIGTEECPKFLKKNFKIERMYHKMLKKQEIISLLKFNFTINI